MYRKWRYTNFLNRTPTSFNDYASIIWTWRLGEYLSALFLRIGANSIYELQLNSIFWLPWTCFSYVSEHLQLVEKTALLIRGGSTSNVFVVIWEQ